MNSQPYQNQTQIQNAVNAVAATAELPAPIDLFLSSKYAQYYVNGTEYKSDLIFYFTPIQSIRDTNFKIKLVNFVFPVSFYLVDSNNYTVVFNTTTYTLTPGNYNVNTFLTMVVAKLTAESISMTYNSITNKYTFTRPSASGTFFFGAGTKCLTLLGFPESTQTASATLSGGVYTLTSSQPVNLSGQYNTVYIDLVNITSNNIGSNTGKRSSVLCSIPVAVNQGALMYFVNNTDSHSVIQDNQMSFLHLRILGEDLNTPVNFQGVDWNMNLEIEYVPHINVPPTINSLDYKQQMSKYLENLKISPNK